jgi:hypothetical protein
MSLAAAEKEGETQVSGQKMAEKGDIFSSIAPTEGVPRLCPACYTCTSPVRIG